MRRLKPLWITLAALTGVFSAISITGYTFIKSQGFETQLNSYLNAKTFKKVEDESTKDEDAEYFKSAYTDEELQKHEKEVQENLMSEGAVLLKNENGALPLARSSKFSCFPTSSVDPVFGGTGSGGVNVTNASTLDSALENTFSIEAVNKTLWNHYLNDLSSYRRVNAKTTGGVISDYQINEAPWSEVNTPEVASTFSAYGDVALVVLARSGGEGNDLPTTQCSDGTDGDFLVLSQAEKDMLHGLKDYKDKGVFKKIVVLLNGSNTLQIDFLNSSEYGIDACLWIGNPVMMNAVL